MYQAAFAIRDDDTSFFTRPEMLDKLYGYAWELGFKVTLSVIPMHRAINDYNVPPNFRGLNKCFAIHENDELVEFIKEGIKNDLIDVVQHGYTHEKPHAHSGRKTSDYILSVKKGRRMLEEAFNMTIRVFVPPYEYVSKPLWIAVYSEGMYFCRSIRSYRNLLLNIPLSQIRPISAIKLFLRKATGRPMHLGFLDISSMVEIVPSYSHHWRKYVSEEGARLSFDRFKKTFDRVYHSGGVFVLLNHYWEYFFDWKDSVTRKLQQKYLYKILDYVDSKPNVWKCGLNELAVTLQQRRRP